MDKREAIMNAALELFAERSFHATPVPLIAKTAQVGAGTIYRYFKDKEDLFLELYVHWRGQFFEAIGKDLSTDIPLRAIFHEIWKRKVDFALANRKAYAFLMAHHHDPCLHEKSARMTERMPGATIQECGTGGVDGSR